FEYSSGGSYIEIGSDFDGLRPLRNGVDDAGSGDGFGLSWDFSSLVEGTFSVRATVYDTLGQSADDSVTVYREPTPPTPAINSPTKGSDFSTQLKLLMSCPDENLSYIEIHRHAAHLNYSAGLVTLDQSTLGDVNGNPADGNHAASGEFGDYYCAPAAAAIAVKLWFDRGYQELMMEDSNFITIDTLAEHLAALFQTREHLGTYDENLLHGLAEFSAAHGNYLITDFMRNPDYFILRSWVEDEQRAVLIGLGGTPGVWLAVDGFSGWVQPDSSYLVRVSNPLTGTKIDVAMRNNLGINEIYFNGSWHRVDLMISLLAKTWVVSRILVGADLNGADGWSFTWNPTGLTEDSLYFFRATGHDNTGLTGSQTVLLRYNCSQTYVLGDYNNDGRADIGDLTYLIEFMTLSGPPPVGSAARADSNCDHNVNIADIVYYMNFLFGNADQPCY
ncbi:MAG: dockerin type I domain-containing protein, partial [Candidatus Zixiibacteriota bacterium]